MKIVCKLFGVPEIFKNGEKVSFSYLKIDAFVYYILLNNTVSRSEVAGLLWPEDSERVAKKNLRNALYHAKKTIHKDFIISTNNTILKLNEELDIYLDVKDFEKEPIKNLHLYEGGFLKGFYLKNSEEYENWVRNQRDRLEEIYTSSYYKKISKDIANGNHDDVEFDIQKLIDIDKYDEKNYRLLMEFYLKTGRNSKVIETYGTLNNILKSELRVEPDESTKKLYRDSMKKINLGKEETQEEYKFYFGREEEIAEINEFFQSFSSDNYKNVLYIEGDEGIGKSFLLKRVFEDFPFDYTKIKINCYQMDSKKALKAVERMIKTFEKEEAQKLFNYIKDIQKDYYLLKEVNSEIFNLEERLLDFFENLNLSKSLVINFEDIQWMDNLSLRILSNLILHIQGDFIFVFSARDEGNLEADKFISTLERYGKVKGIELKNFSKEESYNFLEASLPEVKEREVYEKLYLESEGNPFFLNELVKIQKSKKPLSEMTWEMEKSIRGRFPFVQDRDMELVELFSLFPEGFFVEIIKKISDRDLEEIIKLIDELIKKRILTEVLVDDTQLFKFSHGKIKDYLYSKQYKGKKKHYHKRIGDALEELNKDEDKDLSSLKALIYHFKMGNDELKVLKYQMEILNYYLNFSHEMFPVLDLFVEDGRSGSISELEINKLFLELEDSLGLIKNKNNSLEVDLLELKFFYIKGRYHIREGKYKEGLEDIEFVIRKAKNLNIRDYILKGYKQMIFYNIQKNKPLEMKKFVEDSIELAVESNYHKEISALLRLKGLNNMMLGNYDEGERFLRESIFSFEITNSLANKYAINIAAAYNYIGELKYAQRDLIGSIDEYEKAISLSKRKSAYSSLAIFYLNMGKAYFNLDIKKSKEYFNLANEQYKERKSFWKLPVLDSYLALIEFMERDFEKSKEYLKSAINNSDKMKDPRALGTVNFAQFVLSKSIENKEGEYPFKDLLKKSSDFYQKEALKNLDEFRDVYEIDICKGNRGFEIK